MKIPKKARASTFYIQSLQVKVKCKQNTWVTFLAQLPAPYLTIYNHICCTCLLLTAWDSDSKQSKWGLHNYKLPEHSQIHGKDRFTYHHLLVITRAAAYFIAHSPHAGVPQALFTLHSDKQKVARKNQIKLEKATLKAHFIPLFSSKMSNNRKPPLAFTVKQFPQFNVADPRFIWRIVSLPITSLTNSGGGRGAHSFSFSGIGTVFSCKNKPSSHQYLLGAKSAILTHCWQVVYVWQQPLPSADRSQKEHSCSNFFMHKDQKQAANKNQKVSSLSPTFRPAGQQNPGGLGVLMLLFSVEARRKQVRTSKHSQKLSILPLPVVWEAMKGICVPSMPELWRTGKSRDGRTHGARSEEEHSGGTPQPPPAHTEGGWESPPANHLLLRTRIKTPGQRNQGHAPPPH